MGCRQGDARVRMEFLAEKENGENAILEKELEELRRALEKCSTEKFANVDGFMDGRIKKDDYQRHREELTEKAGELEVRIREAEEKLKVAELGKSGAVLETLDVLEGFVGETALSVEMADTLVKKVVVYEKDRFEIEWNFSEDVYKFITGE